MTLRACAMGLGDVEVLSVDDEGGGPLRVHVRCRAARPPCGGCGGLLWSDGERAVVLVDLPAFGRPVRLVWRKRRWRSRRGCGAGTVTEADREIAPANVSRGAVGYTPGGAGPPAQRRRRGAGLWVARRQPCGAALGRGSAGRGHRADL